MYILKLIIYVMTCGSSQFILLEKKNRHKHLVFLVHNGYLHAIKAPGIEVNQRGRALTNNTPQRFPPILTLHHPSSTISTIWMFLINIRTMFNIIKRVGWKQHKKTMTDFNIKLSIIALFLVLNVT